MQDSHPGRLFRTVQNTAPLSTGGSYHPISATYPQVKPAMEEVWRSKQAVNSTTAMDESAAKRQRVEGAVPGAAHLQRGDTMSKLDMLLDRQPSQQVSAMPRLHNVHSNQQNGQAASNQQPLPTFTNLVAPQGLSGNQRAPMATQMQQALRSFGSSFAPLQRQHSQEGLAGSASGDAPGLSIRPQEVCVPQLPFEWSLKQTIRIFSPEPIQGFTFSPSAATSECQALHAAIRVEQLPSLDGEARIHAALISHRHPEAHWDTATVSGMCRAQQLNTAPMSVVSASAMQLLQQRLHKWHDAFISLYRATMSGTCLAFYFITDQASRQPITVLFCAAGVRGCSQPHAVVSQSSHMLRSRMAQAGLQFSLPLAGATQRPKAQPSEASRTEPLLDRDDLRCTDIKEDKMMAPEAWGEHISDNSTRSALLFVGPRQVHRLFDYLLMEARFEVPGDEPRDLPMLLAPTPFQGSTPYKPQAKVHGAGSQIQPPVPYAPGEVPHLVSLSGHIPPWTVHRLCQALQETQEGRFQLELESPVISGTLNCNPVWVNQQRQASGGGCMSGSVEITAAAHSTAEVHAWREAAQQPDMRRLKQIVMLPGGQYRLRLSG